MHDTGPFVYSLKKHLFHYYTPWKSLTFSRGIEMEQIFLGGIKRDQWHFSKFCWNCTSAAKLQFFQKTNFTAELFRNLRNCSKIVKKGAEVLQTLHLLKTNRIFNPINCFEEELKPWRRIILISCNFCVLILLVQLDFLKWRWESNLSCRCIYNLEKICRT